MGYLKIHKNTARLYRMSGTLDWYVLDADDESWTWRTRWMLGIMAVARHTAESERPNLIIALLIKLLSNLSPALSMFSNASGDDVSSSPLR